MTCRFSIASIPALDESGFAFRAVTTLRSSEPLNPKFTLSASRISPLSAALQRLSSVLETEGPFLARELRAWMSRISPSAEPSGHFEHRRMFPLLQMPEWVAESFSVSCDPAFHQAITYSSLCGYYYTRLIDNFMDADVEVEYRNRSLLSAAGFLASEFQFAYQPYFLAQHDFWNHFREIWLEAAESTAQDAALWTVTENDFERISSRKFAAAGIPVAATCYFYGHPEAIPAWIDFTQTLGRWSQMFDDVLDWHEDRQQGRATWFLTEAERRRDASESVDQWVLRAGSAWGFSLLAEWLEDLQRRARDLGSPGLLDFLEQREMLQREKQEEWRAGLAALTELAGILRMT